MTKFATQAYNMFLQTALFNIVPTVPGTVVVSRGEVGNPEFIPERCFIINTVTIADGFDAAELPDFNGFISNANSYHANFRFPITRIKSFWDILNYYKAATADIGRIRLVTHASQDWLEFPMFPGGDFGAGITKDTLDAYRNSDEEGIRWEFSKSLQSPMLVDITNDIITGATKLNAALLDPLKLAGPPVGDTKLFLDLVADLYHIKYGGIATKVQFSTTLAALTTAQRTQLLLDLDFLDVQIRTRLVGSTVGSVANTNVVTSSQLDTIKSTILGFTPAQLELPGPKQALPAAAIADLATAMAASPRVEDDLRSAISGGLAKRMFSDRTGGILVTLENLNGNLLELEWDPVINDWIRVTSWSSIAAIPDLEDFFLTCNDLYMIKNGNFTIGANPITASQRTTIRNGVMAISDIVRKKITDVGPLTLSKLNALRNAIENMSPGPLTTDSLMTMDARTPKQVKVAVAGLKSGFRTNLLKVRSLMKSTSFVDIRGCMIGKTPNTLISLQNFLGVGANKPTVSAPDWWQSFPDGAIFQGGATGTSVFTEINDFVANGLPPANPAHLQFIHGSDVTAAFALWKPLISFDAHFTFISALFDDTDAARFSFASLEWRIWQIGGVGAGIPVLKMEAQRLDDLVSLNVSQLIDRFQIIFEVASASGLTAAQKTTLLGIQPHVASYKTLKAAIIAKPGPTPIEVADFYTQLGVIGSAIAIVPNAQSPGTLQPGGGQNKGNLDVYSANVEKYIFDNLSALLGTFFTAIRAELALPNSDIRYYLNTGLVLPVQSASHPVVSDPVMMISSTGANGMRTFMKCIRAWMKIQWTGTAVEKAQLYSLIDALPVPSTGNEILSLARRVLVSDGNPGGNPPPAGLASEVCPTPAFHPHIIETP